MNKVSIHEIKEVKPGIYKTVIGKNRAKVTFKNIGDVCPALKGNYAISKKGIVLSLTRKRLHNNSGSINCESRYYYKATILIASVTKRKNVNCGGLLIDKIETAKQVWGEQ